MLKSFEIANVRCGGCANTITVELTNAGFKSVDVDLSTEPRKVTAWIESEQREEEFIRLLRKLGYPLFDAEIGTLQSTGLKAKSFVSCAVGKFELSKTKE